MCTQQYKSVPLYNLTPFKLPSTRRPVQYFSSFLFAPQPTSFNCIFPRYLHGARCAHCPLFAPASLPISSSPYRKAFPSTFLGGRQKGRERGGVKFIAALPVVTGNGKLKYNLDQMIITSFYTHGLFHPHPLLPPPAPPLTAPSCYFIAACWPLKTLSLRQMLSGSRMGVRMGRGG